MCDTLIYLYITALGRSASIFRIGVHAADMSRLGFSSVIPMHLLTNQSVQAVGVRDQVASNGITMHDRERERQMQYILVLPS